MAKKTPKPAKKTQGAYKVGYCKPPIDHQFPPGQSGNPKGRPKGSKNFATNVKEILDKEITVKDQGKTRTIPAQKAMLMRLCEMALNGNVRALKDLLELAARFNNDEVKDNDPVNLAGDEADILAAFEADILARNAKKTDEDAK